LASRLNETIFASASGFGSAERSFTGIAWLYRSTIWSDTVNTASRMESQGVAGRVQVGDTTYALVKDDFVCEERGEIEIRGRGLLTTYFVLAGR
jgi:class 3 adenylate cyclase